MANFKYAKHTLGMTIAFLELDANGTVAIGDLLDATVAPAVAVDASVKYLAMSSAATGEDLLVMPVLNGTVLKGTVSTVGGIARNAACGITDTQTIDTAAANPLFIALEDGAQGDEINVLVTAGM